MHIAEYKAADYYSEIERRFKNAFINEIFCYSPLHLSVWSTLNKASSKCSKSKENKSCFAHALKEYSLNKKIDCKCAHLYFE